MLVGRFDEHMYGYSRHRAGHMGEGDANRSIEDVMELMSEELDRLKEVLATLRLARAPQEQIRWHIQQIDAREDELLRLRKLIEH